MNESIIAVIGISVCVFALLTVLSRDIFHSAVWLTMSLLSIAGIYFYLDAEFLGVVQILVYIGGIITLFIFAIKLTSKIGDVAIRQANSQVVVSAIVAIGLFLIFVKLILAHPWASPQGGGEIISLKQIGNLLFTAYLLPFEFISVVLLAAMVGAIVIGKAKK